VGGHDSGDPGTRRLALSLRLADGRVAWSSVTPAATTGPCSGFDDVAIARRGRTVAVGTAGQNGAPGESYLLAWFDAAGRERRVLVGGCDGGRSVAAAVKIDGAGHAYVAGTLKAQAGAPPAMFVQSWTAGAGLRWQELYEAGAGLDGAGYDLALTAGAVYSVGTDGAGVMLIKHHRASQ
jgi:hypothetical protein